MNKYKKRNFLIILISPSGGGKSAILRQILNIRDDTGYSISYTTREPRIDETNGIDYNFISNEEFKKLKESGDLLESAVVHDYWYGTSKNFIESELEKGKHIIMDIDVQGAKQVIEKKIDVVTIFIIPPSLEILIERLRKRRTDTEEEINTRLNSAKKEMEDIHNFQYLVINDDLHKAIQEVNEIINTEEKKIHRFVNIKGNFYGG
ncbi:MAG: guanylate kinase [Candidatus Cloacimonetes bacterium]|nr:guanylate kinase [Candidatus Cloacimonadota bacterium]